MKEAIKTIGLTKTYKSLTAVDHLDLVVEQGELFSLLGVNGAGKTTTIKMLSCLTRPTEGDALLNGRSICTDSAAVREIIGVSPQETAVAPNLTVQENLRMMCGIHGGIEIGNRSFSEYFLIGLIVQNFTGTDPVIIGLAGFKAVDSDLVVDVIADHLPVHNGPGPLQMFFVFPIFHPAVHRNCGLPHDSDSIPYRILQIWHSTENFVCGNSFQSLRIQVDGGIFSRLDQRCI